MDFTCNIDEKNNHSTPYTYITFLRYYLVCFAALCIQLQSHSSLPRCYIFSPAVEARGKHEVLLQPDGSILSGDTVHSFMNSL